MQNINYINNVTNTYTNINNTISHICIVMSHHFLFVFYSLKYCTSVQLFSIDTQHESVQGTTTCSLNCL